MILLMLTCSKSDHSTEYESSNIRKLRAYKIMYINKSYNFYLFDLPRARDNFYKFNVERI